MHGFGKLGLAKLAEQFVLVRRTLPLFYVGPGAGALIGEKRFLWLCQKVSEEVSEAERVGDNLAYVQLVYLSIDHVLYDSVALAFTEQETQAVLEDGKSGYLDWLRHLRRFTHQSANVLSCILAVKHDCLCNP